MDYQNLKIVCLPDSSRIVSPPQLDVMFEFHATYRELVLQNLLEQNAGMLSEIPIDNFIALQNWLWACRAAAVILPVLVNHRRGVLKPKEILNLNVACDRYSKCFAIFGLIRGDIDANIQII